MKMSKINTYETKDRDLDIAKVATDVCIAAAQSMCLANSSLETTAKGTFKNGMATELTSKIDIQNKKIILKVEVDITNSKEFLANMGKDE